MRNLQQLFHAAHSGTFADALVNDFQILLTGIDSVHPVSELFFQLRAEGF